MTVIFDPATYELDSEDRKHLDRIVQACAIEFETTPEAISLNRTWASGPESKARQIAMWLYRHYVNPASGYEYRLAVYFDRHVSTVFSNIRKIDRQLDHDPRIRRYVEALIKKLRLRRATA